MGGQSSSLARGHPEDIWLFVKNRILMYFWFNPSDLAFCRCLFVLGISVLEFCEQNGEDEKVLGFFSQLKSFLNNDLPLGGLPGKSWEVKTI